MLKSVSMSLHKTAKLAGYLSDAGFMFLFLTLPSALSLSLSLSSSFQMKKQKPGLATAKEGECRAVILGLNI